ncbi:putative 20S proteasome beta2 subunit [Histomonas meleagridis]|uniref:putative 20S proteasome beta2 subunit n=1 Tax=Histomonas meleagridis TaxID=135588 RepID=UPI00355971E5|nr:putative 20S proteasome beta2 subunit [Histomonas meleagridis]KAH0797448.1 putative 20S proteasome beta2 subunit [Histomonas meleagridis]
MSKELGFDFSLYSRNTKLLSKTGEIPHLKTGTTIAAITYNGGVVLGADTRATAGPVVAVKDEFKIHYISDNIWCCGAGTAADTQQITDLISSKLRLFQMNTGMQPQVAQAANLLSSRLFKYGGYIQAALILGGYDYKGPSVYTIYPDGACSKAPFTTMGSGSYAAVSVLENGWRPNMTEDEAKELVANAILAGITNDLGSGSNVNLCVINEKGSQYISGYKVTNQRQFRMAQPIIACEIEVMKESVRPISVPEVHLEILDGVAE